MKLLNFYLYAFYEGWSQVWHNFYVLWINLHWHNELNYLFWQGLNTGATVESYSANHQEDWIPLDNKRNLCFCPRTDMYWIWDSEDVSYKGPFLDITSAQQYIKRFSYEYR